MASNVQAGMNYESKHLDKDPVLTCFEEEHIFLRISCWRDKPLYMHASLCGVAGLLPVKMISVCRGSGTSG